MKLPLTLPLANHLPREVNLGRRVTWSPEREGPTTIRFVEIELLSEAEEIALRQWLPGLGLPGLAVQS